MEEAHITAAKIWAFLLLAIKISSLGLVIIAPKNNGSIINVGVRENSLASTFIFLQKKKHKYILFG